MENKDWRTAKIGASNEKHGVSDLRPRPVHLGLKPESVWLFSAATDFN